MEAAANRIGTLRGSERGCGHILKGSAPRGTEPSRICDRQLQRRALARCKMAGRRVPAWAMLTLGNRRNRSWAALAVGWALQLASPSAMADCAASERDARGRCPKLAPAPVQFTRSQKATQGDGGSLLVEANVKGAVVEIDGAARGRAPVRVSGLLPRNSRARCTLLVSVDDATGRLYRIGGRALSGTYGDTRRRVAER